MQLLFSGCSRPQVSCCIIQLPPITLTSERTSLENQILGTYAEIREDVWLVSSSQAVEGLKITSTTNTNVKVINVNFKVIKALETIEYDQDKITNYKARGYLGENNEGFLSYMKNSVIEDNPEMKLKLLEIMNEVNDARTVLMLEVINRNANLSMDDLPEVKKTTAKINQNNALKGEWIQNQDGEWIKKE